MARCYVCVADFAHDANKEVKTSKKPKSQMQSFLKKNQKTRKTFAFIRVWNLFKKHLNEVTGIRRS